MKNVTVQIADWDKDTARNSIDFLATHDDFDFKNLTVEDHSYFYEQGFGRPAKLVSAYNRDGKKVGHAVLYMRDMKSGSDKKCVLMSDFYVDIAYRNLRTVSRMYTALKTYLEEQNVVSMFSVSNEKSTRLNKRFLDISDFQQMRFGIGISNCYVGSGAHCDVTTAFLDPALSDDYSRYFTYSHFWDVETLRKRIGTPDEQFKVHCFGDTLVVSQRTRKLGIPVVLIVGLFSRKERFPQLSGKMLDGICASHRIPFYSAEANDLPNGLLKNFVFVKKITVYHRDMPQDQRYCLLDLDLSLGAA